MNNLQLFRLAQQLPLGTRLFSWVVSMVAPYFRSIQPHIEQLEPNYARVALKNRRTVQNHLKTVHAIAMCNLAELTAGLMVDASLPKGMRWIPKGMQVQYLAKARGTLQAVALPAQPIVAAAEGYALPVTVSVRDGVGTEVFSAVINMWMSPAK